MGAVRKLERNRVGQRKSPRAERIPHGTARKMSEIIVELAQPMLAQAQDEEQFQ